MSATPRTQPEDLMGRLANFDLPTALANRSRIVLVLGPHRSGTSLVAKAMTCLGAGLGAAAEWSGPDNPSGFWEHRGVLAIDEAVLKNLNRTWDDIAPLESALDVWLSMSPNAIALQRAARDLLRAELSIHPVFAIKEPRMCRLLPFWGPVFHAVVDDVSVVRVARHPAQSAASLHRRNGVPIDAGLAIWAEHVRAGHAGSDPAWSATTVLYDRMLATPIAEITRIGAALGLPMDRSSAISFAETFVKRELRHERSVFDLPTEIAVQWEAERLDGMEPAP